MIVFHHFFFVGSSSISSMATERPVSRSASTAFTNLDLLTIFQTMKNKKKNGRPTDRIKREHAN